MLKGSRLYSILFNKCPRCQKGNFFVSNNPYNLKRFSAMHDHCPICDESFRREPGFYYGAMYASYGLTVIYGLLLFILMVWWLRLGILTFLLTFSLSVIFFMPMIYRFSRLIWINLFVGPKKQI